MKNLIEKYLSPDEIQKLAENANTGILLVGPVSISLDDKDRIGLRTMAEGREGTARTICKVALSFEECLPRNEDPREMEAGLLYFDQLSAVKVKLAKLYEMVDDTLAGLGNDLMGMLDRYNSYLQTARTKNANLDMALQPVDEYNQRFARRNGEEETPEEPKA